MVFMVLVGSRMVSKHVSVPSALAAIPKAAEQGSSTAQFDLGVAYGKGEGVPKDYKQSAQWFRKAAEQGHASAQLNLGVMYFKGQGVHQDFAQAYVWLSLSAAQGNVVAAKNRDLAAKELTLEQMSQAKQLSVEIQGKLGPLAGRTVR
jgi:uncharacterized protein